MTLYEELYFDITLEGTKSEIKKVISALRGGALDDFFEFSEDYLYFANNYDELSDDYETVAYLSNEDYGIEIDELDTADILDVLCSIGKNIELRGEIYDGDCDAYRFISNEFDSYFVNADKIKVFNDELDEQIRREQKEEEEE